jgi:hypothetical protein
MTFLWPLNALRAVALEEPETLPDPDQADGAADWEH